MAVKLHDIRCFIEDGLTEAYWDELVEVNIEDINNKEFYVTYTEIQDIDKTLFCKSKYKIKIELCNE